MIIAAPGDYREGARRRLPRFIFDYIDGGAYDERTLFRNVADLGAVSLRQRVLRDVGALSLETELLGRHCTMPVALAPLGMTGMCARRGEVQAARAATNAGIPFTLSSVSVCPIAEVQAAVDRPIWFQLYVLKDHGFMRDVLSRALAGGTDTLLFTVDLPVMGARYRDVRSGMARPKAGMHRLMQALMRPRWALDVGLMGRPHDLGNISAYQRGAAEVTDFAAWVAANFDPSISWKDLQWIRDFWPGKLLLKGILDVEDAREAVRFGADGIVVSNHGGRQLDGVPSTAQALPGIADAVGDALTVLADSGVRSGLDVVRMLALGARGVLLGRPFVYALATAGEAGVSHLLALIAKEMRVAMMLTGARRVSEITRESLVRAQAEGERMPARAALVPTPGFEPGAY